MCPPMKEAGYKTATHFVHRLANSNLQSGRFPYKRTMSELRTYDWTSHCYDLILDCTDELHLVQSQKKEQVVSCVDSLFRVKEFDFVIYEKTYLQIAFTEVVVIAP